MPRKVINYSKTKIYKIVCSDVKIKECCVGSTTNFTNRKRHHKSACTKESNVGYILKFTNLFEIMDAGPTGI